MVRWLRCGRSEAALLIALAIGACTSFSPSATSDVDAGDAGASNDATAAPPCDPSTTASDSKHCGACGHDCLGGSCVQGTCKPIVIGVSTDAPIVDLVVDATRVLWISSENAGGGGKGHLYSCPKAAGCSGAAPLVLTDTNPVNEVHPGGLASDGVTTYASFVFGNGKIVSVEPNNTLKTLGGFNIHAFAPDIIPKTGGGGFFLLSYYEPGGGTDRTVYSWDGTSETPAATFAGLTGNFEHMAITKERIYLGSHSNGLIVSCTKDNCTSPSTVSPSSNDDSNVQSMTTDNRRIFWTHYNGALRSCPDDGNPCAITQELGPAQLNTAKAMTVTYAAGALYIAVDNGDLLACDPRMCASTLRTIIHEKKLDVTYPLFGHTVTADDLAVYWAAIDDEGAPSKYRVMKLAK